MQRHRVLALGLLFAVSSMFVAAAGQQIESESWIELSVRTFVRPYEGHIPFDERCLDREQALSLSPSELGELKRGFSEVGVELFVADTFEAFPCVGFEAEDLWFGVRRVQMSWAERSGCGTCAGYRTLLLAPVGRWIVLPVEEASALCSVVEDAVVGARSAAWNWILDHA